MTKSRNIANNGQTVQNEKLSSRWTWCWLAGRSALPRLGVENNNLSFFFFKRSLEHTGTQPKICYWTKEHLMIRMMTKKTKDAPFWKLAKERWRVRPPLSNKPVPATDLSLGLVRDSSKWWFPLLADDWSSLFFPLLFPPVIPHLFLLSVRLFSSPAVRSGRLWRKKNEMGKMVN